MGNATPAPVLTQITPTKIIGSIPFVAGTQQMLKIPRDFIYRSFNLQLTGSITTTGATTAANLNPGDEWGCVTAIELVANGGNVLRYISGEQLCMLNFLLTGYAKRLQTLTGGGANTYPFISVEPLWMCTPGDIGYPLDTQLNSTLLDDLYIRVTWGGNTSINNAAGTTISAQTQITISADMSYFLNSQLNPAFTLSQITQRRFANIAQTPAGQGGYDWNVPVSQIYALFLFNTKTAGQLVDAPNALGTILIQSGTNQFQNYISEIEQQMNAFRTPGLNTINGIGGIPPGFASSNMNMDAWTLIKFPKETNITESFNLKGFQNCDVFLQNQSGTAVDITAISYALVPVANVTG